MLCKQTAWNLYHSFTSCFSVSLDQSVRVSVLPLALWISSRCFYGQDDVPVSQPLSEHLRKLGMYQTPFLESGRNRILPVIS